MSLMRSQKLLCSLAVFVAFACVTNVQADYSYAEGTPGTQWGVAAPVVATAAGAAIPDSRKLSTIGLTYNGAAAGAAAVLNTNQFDCGAIITAISAGLRAGIPVVPIPPALVAGADAAAIQAHQLATAARATYDIKKHRYDLASQHMNEPVIGVAVVDYGTVGAPDIRAFLSRSGSKVATAANEQAALDYAASLQPHGTPLHTAGNWRFIDRATDDIQYVKNHRSTRLVNLPPLGGTEANDITAWANGAAAAPAHSEGILFAVGPTLVAKKWPNGAGGYHSDSLDHRTTCAMQKLLYTLYGMGLNGANIAGGFQPLQADAHRRAAPAAAGPGRLVCAAESAHITLAAAGIRLKKWDGTDFDYPRSTLVPSCTMCQSIVPEILDGSLHPAPCAPLGVGTVVNGAPGTCGFAVAHGASCQVTCNHGFYPSMPTSKCTFGRYSGEHMQQCLAPCQISDLAHQPAGVAAVAHTANTAAGLTPDFPWTGVLAAGPPTCSDQLKPGHACTLACAPDATLHPPAPKPLVCIAGNLQFPLGPPVCEPDCATPAGATETAHAGAGRVTSTLVAPAVLCEATLKLGSTCAPTCAPATPHIISNSKCGPNRVLTSIASCGAAPPPLDPRAAEIERKRAERAAKKAGGAAAASSGPVKTRALIQTGSAQVDSGSVKRIARFASATLKQAHSALQP